MRRGPFVAEIVSDRRASPRVYHCIVQRQDSAEILMWTQEKTLDEAADVAMRHLTELHAQDKRQNYRFMDDGDNQAA